MRKLTTIVASVLMLSFPVFGATYEVLDQKRVVEVIDVVDGSMIVDVAQKIDKLSNESSKPIDIIINSPGGAVLVGTSVVDAMTIAKSRGATLRCFTGVLSASMAFIILAHCDERYALAGAKLLFHPVSVGSQGRLQEILIQLEEIRKLEIEVMQFLLGKLRLDRLEFHRHYFAETMWSGQSLAKATGGNCKFLCIVDNVKGVEKTFILERPKSFFLRLKFKNEYEAADRILRKAGISLTRHMEDKEEGAK